MKTKLIKTRTEGIVKVTRKTLTKKQRAALSKSDRRFLAGMVALAEEMISLR